MSLNRVRCQGKRVIGEAKSVFFEQIFQVAITATSEKSPILFSLPIMEQIERVLSKLKLHLGMEVAFLVC